MSDPINIGTIACENGTLAGAIYDVYAGLVDPSVLPEVETAFKRLSYATAAGLRDGIAAAITDGYVVGVESGELVGLDGGGGGGGAPVGAQYIVAASDGTLTAERVATATATVTVDTATPGQIRFNVPDASTTAKGVVELATSAETTAGLAVQASDTRLSDARAPTAHASSHASGGGDEIDITQLGGFSGFSAEFLAGDGTWAAPTSGAPSNAEYLTNGSVIGLSNERAVTDTATVAWDWSTGGQAKANVPSATISAEGVVELAADGETSSGVVVQGDDGRVRGSSQSVHSVRGSTARGSSRTLVFRWQTVVDNLGSPDITYSDSSFYGGYWTVSNEGVYSVSVSMVHLLANSIAIKVASSLPTTTFSETSIVAVAQATSSSYVSSVSWTGRVTSGQRIWISAAAEFNADNSDPNLNRCTITRVR